MHNGEFTQHYTQHYNIHVKRDEMDGSGGEWGSGETPMVIYMGIAMKHAAGLATLRWVWCAGTNPQTNSLGTLK